MCCKYSIIQLGCMKLHNLIFRSAIIWMQLLEGRSKQASIKKLWTSIRIQPCGSNWTHETCSLQKSFPSFVDSAKEVMYTSHQAAILLCPLCLGVLDQPIELVCSNLVWASCCSKWIEKSGTVSCPCCSYHQLDNLTMFLPSTVVQDLLGTLRLACT